MMRKRNLIDRGVYLRWVRIDGTKSTIRENMLMGTEGLHGWWWQGRKAVVKELE
jgi:hypothetical protein